MKKFLYDIGITESGYFNDLGDYIIDITNSDDFSKVYSSLISCVMLEEVGDSSDFSGGTVQFESDDYKIVLTYNFDSDLYKLICSKI